MATLKHTPGPWRVEEGYVKPRGQFAKVVAQEVAVAECWLDGDDQDTEATEALFADARLIAAAPTLADALEALGPFLSDCRHNPPNDLPADCPKCAALRARGAALRAAGRLP